MQLERVASSVLFFRVQLLRQEMVMVVERAAGRRSVFPQTIPPLSFRTVRTST